MTGCMSPSTRAMLGRLLQRFAPPPSITLTEWSERHRYIAQGTSRPGPYRVQVTPYLRQVQEEVTYALTGIEPRTPINARPSEIGVQKAAQQGYTDGVLANAIGYVCQCLRQPQMTLFAKEGAARDFAVEKLEPMIEASPALAAIIDVTSRARGERALHRSYPGGFLKLVGGRSPSNVKSTPLPFVAVEEPDDTDRDLRGQGGAITLARERTKSYAPNSLILIGGTPTIKGLSIVEDVVLKSDQRHYHVPCHECDQAEPLRWEQVTYLSDVNINHPVYGHALPDTARYACPHCGALWTDAERVRNVARADELALAGETGVGWVAHGAFDGRAGFYLNELLSPFVASRLPALVRKYLEAQHQLGTGDDEKWIAFSNNTLGLAYEVPDDAPDTDALTERGEDYAPGTVPHGAAVVTMGVDVQDTWLHVHLWAWGPGEECWLVGRHIIPGNPPARADAVWDALAERLAQPLRHASGANLYVAAASIDASDGEHSDAVYSFARKWRRRRQPDGSALQVMAIKGSTTTDREIYSLPRKLDHTRTDKAARFGLSVHMVGVHKAKDLLHTSLKLTGHGAGRLHWYATVEPEFLAGLTAEVKWRERGSVVWRPKAGSRSEDLDCHNYARHAARRLRLHVWTAGQWQAAEARLRHFERDLVQQAEAATAPSPVADDTPAAPAQPETPPTPPRATRRPQRRPGGWVSGWRG